MFHEFLFLLAPSHIGPDSQLMEISTAVLTDLGCITLSEDLIYAINFVYLQSPLQNNLG